MGHPTISAKVSKPLTRELLPIRSGPKRRQTRDGSSSSRVCPLSPIRMCCLRWASARQSITQHDFTASSAARARPKPKPRLCPTLRPAAKWSGARPGESSVKRPDEGPPRKARSKHAPLRPSRPMEQIAPTSHRTRHRKPRRARRFAQVRPERGKPRRKPQAPVNLGGKGVRSLFPKSTLAVALPCLAHSALKRADHR